MPYTVNFFMSQVSLGLLNGCSFHRNAGHVVQGGPVSSHLNPGQKMHQGFIDAMLQSVGFQEYHPDFPHKKYTLGYAGRPGGPDFYVSTMGKYTYSFSFSCVIRRIWNELELGIKLELAYFNGIVWLTLCNNTINR